MIEHWSIILLQHIFSSLTKVPHGDERKRRSTWDVQKYPHFISGIPVSPPQNPFRTISIQSNATHEFITVKVVEIPTWRGPGRRAGVALIINAQERTRQLRASRESERIIYRKRIFGWRRDHNVFGEWRCQKDSGTSPQPAAPTKVPLLLHIITGPVDCRVVAARCRTMCLKNSAFPARWCDDDDTGRQGDRI